MQLCPEALHLWVEGFCRCIGRAFKEVVQHFLFSGFDTISCRLDLSECAGIDLLVPFVQFGPCFINRKFAFEYVTYFTDERVCFLHLWIKVKEQFGAFLLVFAPFLTRLGKQVPWTGQQLNLGISIGEFLRFVLLLLDAFATSILAWLLRVLLAIVCTLLRL